MRFCEFGRLSAADYKTLYGFGTFSDDSTHPSNLAIVGKRKDGTGITTSAAGAYQTQQGTYDDAVDAKIVSDFTPRSQDAIALWLMATKGALPYVDAGQVQLAIQKLNRTWVSLPGGSHPKLSMANAIALFETYVAAAKVPAR